MGHDEQVEQELDADIVSSIANPPGPRPELEERVVSALRAQRLLQAPPTLQLRAAPRAPSTRVRAAWLSGAVAAGLAFFIGLRVGEARSAPVIADRATAAPPVIDTSLVALQVRETARAYVMALSTVDPQQRDALTAAIGTFRTAADQIIRLTPESDIAFAIRVAYPSSFADAPATLALLKPPTRIIWF